MRKYLFILFIFASGNEIFSQIKDPKIEFYTDSDIKRSSWSMAAHGSPYFTNRRLVRETVNVPGQTGGEDNNDRFATQGRFGYSFGGDLIYSVSNSLDIWLGVEYATTGYRGDSLVLGNEKYSGEGNLAFLNIPIQFSFRGNITEVFDLEFIPRVSLNFLQRFDETRFVEGGEDINYNWVPDSRSINYTVGIALSGNFHVSDNMSIFARAFFNYILYPLKEDESRFLRTTYFSTGLCTGVRYYFN